MDDDPEPSLDPMVLKSSETKEQPLGFREQKCAAEIGEESTLESGDIGPAVDPESPKKSVADKALPDQTGSETSIFRRKEWPDEGQEADLSGSVKSSAASLRKLSRGSSQRLTGQESRRSSQRPPGQLPPLSQKPSRAQAVNEADAKDPTWVSQRTGKVMKCRSQQTSCIWERKTLSEILRPSVPNRDEGSERTTAEDDAISAGETAHERRPGSNQVEGKVSKHSSQHGSRRSSQRSNAPLSAQGPKHSIKGMVPDEDVTWISQKTGREMKCKAQQTSRVWGLTPLSDFFPPSRKDSQAGQEEESGFSTADDVFSSGETGTEELIATTQESCHTSQREGSVSKDESGQQLERSEARRNSQETTEQPPLPNPTSPHKEVTNEEVTEEPSFWFSPKTGKMMKCKSQQTSLVWEYCTLSDVLHVYEKASKASELGEEEITDEEEGDAEVDQGTMKDAQHSIQSLASEKSKQESQRAEERKKQKIDQAQQTDSAQSIKKEVADSGQQTSSMDLCQDPGHGSEQTSGRSSQEFVGQEDESRGPSDTESEPAELDRTPSCVSEAEEAPWVSQKTGRTVRNQIQQTDRSWLQYFALKSQKLKRCISQQTEESFLQWYKRGKLKQKLREHRESHADQDIHRCTLCGDIYTEGFPFDLDTLSSFSTMSILSTFSTQETAGAERTEEGEPRPSGGDEEPPQTQQPLEQASRRGSQQTGGQEAPDGVGQESQDSVRRAEESGVASEGSLLYTEVREKSQQTYSLISFVDGIWLNRKTGKLLVTHCQQTSETSLPQGREFDGQPSQRGAQQEREGEPREEGLQSADEVEKLVCTRLSEATLLSAASPDVEDGQLYTVVSLEEGSWVNVKTGKLLASQSQQTAGSSERDSAEEKGSVKVPSRKSPEEGQVGIP